MTRADSDDEDGQMPDSGPSKSKTSLGRDQISDSEIELDDDQTTADGPRRSRRRNIISDDENKDPEATPPQYLTTVAQGLTQAFEDTQLELDQDLQETQLTQNQDAQIQSQDASQSQSQVAQTKSIHDQYSERLISAYEEGLDQFVRVNLDLEDIPTRRWAIARQSSKSKCRYDDLVNNLVLMLLQMNGDVLKHVIQGDLPAASRADPDLAKVLYNLKRMPKDSRCPSTYGQYLVDKKGVSPTADEVCAMLDIAEQYCDGFGVSLDPHHLIANKIDTTIGTKLSLADSRDGKRKYLAKPDHAAVLTTFIRNTRARMSLLPGDEPLKRPLVEIGYASKPLERLDQHKKHTSSNYLMNLFEAICAAYFKERFFIEQHVLFWHTHFTHAMFAEILLSTAGLVYITTGGGFSHFPAGISHNGATEENNSKNYYSKMESNVMEGKMFRANVEEEVRKRKAAAELAEGHLSNAGNIERFLKSLNSVAQAVEDANEEEKELDNWAMELQGEMATIEEFEVIFRLAKEE